LPIGFLVCLAVFFLLLALVVVASIVSFGLRLAFCERLHVCISDFRGRRRVPRGCEGGARGQTLEHLVAIFNVDTFEDR